MKVRLLLLLGLVWLSLGNMAVAGETTAPSSAPAASAWTAAAGRRTNRADAA